jgi:tRNA modification GTPase
MSGRSAVQVVRLTPPGRGAIATLLVEGPGAVELLGGLCFPNSGRPLGCRRTDQLVVGRFGREPGEEVVVCRCSDKSVELHCHGGHAAVAMIQQALVERGGQVVAWQDWVVGHHRDPITAAAHIALAEARTERTAAILLDQYHGALRRALEEIDEALGRGEMLSAGRQIDALLTRAEVGRHLTRPWQVVLIGRPNVGKSSLINALVGYPRAIVHHTPGTTRDVVSATTAVDGWPIELSDTAGLSLPDGVHGGAAAGPVEREPWEGAGLYQSEEALHQAGIGRARERLAGAELVVLVFDASEPWSAADGALIEAWPDGLVIHNKSDLPRTTGRRPPGLWTSALTGDGVDALGQALADGLVPEPPPPGAAVPFTSAQCERLAGYRLKAGGEQQGRNCPRRDRR